MKILNQDIDSKWLEEELVEICEFKKFAPEGFEALLEALLVSIEQINEMYPGSDYTEDEVKRAVREYIHYIIEQAQKGTDVAV